MPRRLTIPLSVSTSVDRDFAFGPVTTPGNVCEVVDSLAAKLDKMQRKEVSCVCSMYHYAALHLVATEGKMHNKTIKMLCLCGFTAFIQLYIPLSIMYQLYEKFEYERIHIFSLHRIIENFILICFAFIFVGQSHQEVADELDDAEWLLKAQKKGGVQEEYQPIMEIPGYASAQDGKIPDVTVPADWKIHHWPQYVTVCVGVVTTMVCAICVQMIMAMVVATDTNWLALAKDCFGLFFINDLDEKLMTAFGPGGLYSTPFTEHSTFKEVIASVEVAEEAPTQRAQMLVKLIQRIRQMVAYFFMLFSLVFFVPLYFLKFGARTAV